MAFTDDSDGTADMEGEDFRFYNGWDAARDMGDMFVLSKFNILPRQGGFLDQDYFEAQDLLTYLRGYTWAYHINHPQEQGEDKGRDIAADIMNAHSGGVSNIEDFVN